jgi:hypothetical protein
MHIHALGWTYHVSQKKNTWQQGSCSMISPGQVSEHVSECLFGNVFGKGFMNYICTFKAFGVILLQFEMD